MFVGVREKESYSLSSTQVVGSCALLSLKLKCCDPLGPSLGVWIADGFAYGCFYG